MPDKSFFFIDKPSEKSHTNWRYVWILPIGILLIASVMKIMAPESMAVQFEPLNLKHPDMFILSIGLVELGIVLTFLIPATRLIGFLLLTAFIGGIIATELLITGGVPVFPIFLQIALWAGVYFEKKNLISHHFSESRSTFNVHTKKGDS